MKELIITAAAALHLARQPARQCNHFCQHIQDKQQASRPRTPCLTTHTRDRWLPLNCIGQARCLQPCAHATHVPGIHQTPKMETREPKTLRGCKGIRQGFFQGRMTSSTGPPSISSTSTSSSVYSASSAPAPSKSLRPCKHTGV